MSPDKTNTCDILTPTDVIAEARKWLGTRWVHQGRNEAGIDCAGLVVRVLGDLNLPVEDMIGYRRTPDAHAFLEHIRRQTQIAPGPMPGTIAIFRQSQFPCHTGFFAEQDGKLTLIHSYMTYARVLEQDYAHEWPKLFVEARLITGITY